MAYVAVINPPKGTDAWGDSVVISFAPSNFIVTEPWRKIYAVETLVMNEFPDGVTYIVREGGDDGFFLPFHKNTLFGLPLVFSDFESRRN